MFQLILTIIAIGLTAALLLVSITYLNPNLKKSQALADSAIVEMQEMSQVYSIITAASDGTAPATTSDADGGFSSIFLPYLKFPPKIIPGYTISYHKMGVTTNVYSELNYFCMTPTSAVQGDIIEKTLPKIRQEFPSGQVITTNSSCADPLSGAGTSFSDLPKIVYFVRYIPKA